MMKEQETETSRVQQINLQQLRKEKKMRPITINPNYGTITIIFRN